MPWLQLTLNAHKDSAEQYSDALSECGAVSVTMQDAADQPLYEPAPGETPLWADIQLVGMFAADVDMDAVIARLKQQLQTTTLPEYSISLLEDQDWERVWMDDFHAIQFAEHLWICPSWLTPPDPQATNIMLDPGLAFGSGTHPNTAMCLQWLGQHELQGKRVIDYGCGSGVLAIAAALLGASEVWAIDIDPQALQATRENAEKNHVSEKLQIGYPKDLPDSLADVVIANIVAGPLLELAPMLAEHTRTAGHVVLSGILENQLPQIQDCYQTWFMLDPPMQQQEWCRLSGTRLAGHPGNVNQ